MKTMLNAPRYAKTPLTLRKVKTMENKKLIGTCGGDNPCKYMLFYDWYHCTNKQAIEDMFGNNKVMPDFGCIHYKPKKEG
jgi:hypothetical protein